MGDDLNSWSETRTLLGKKGMPRETYCSAVRNCISEFAVFQTKPSICRRSIRNSVTSSALLPYTRMDRVVGDIRRLETNVSVSMPLRHGSIRIMLGCLTSQTLRPRSQYGVVPR